MLNRVDQSVLQQVITVIEQCSESWVLKLFPDKIRYIEIRKNSIGENKYYTTTNNVTKTIDTHEKQKDLRVIFDSKLTFDEHIRYSRHSLKHF